MRAPLTWLREYVQLAEDCTARSVADALIRIGLEVETVDVIGEGTSGPLVVGRVVEIEELTGFAKPIRLCRVDVGPEHGDSREIICGASNFEVGDHVVVALPGTVLPGGFEISARKTYGHLSDGMICSARELGLGDDHSGILVLDGGTAGHDAAPLLGLGEPVLDIAVTPDRGYCLSIRGVAREASIALAADYTDPVTLVDEAALPLTDTAIELRIDDLEAASRYVAVRLDGFDPLAPTPTWMQVRLAAAGMRPVSLAVDVTNYVMLELGQPLHAFDADTVTDAIVVRRAEPGESLVTLDHVERRLDPDDLLIADGSGPIGLAGTMGGLSTEISQSTRSIILEAAHFAPSVVARMARRHRLQSEASRRFERGVDPALPMVAAARAAQLLAQLGGAQITGVSTLGDPPVATSIEIAPDLAARVAGTQITAQEAAAHLSSVGAHVDRSDEARWAVEPPSWRPDLTDPADLVEEVVRLHGYESLPATLPSPPAGRGLTPRQRLQRAASRALAHQGFVEVLCYPFLGQDELAQFAVEGERAQLTALANPLSDEAGLMRTTLLPGLCAAARRNFSRGAEGVALYEVGLVFGPWPAAPVERPEVTGPPTAEQVRALDQMLPEQPRHLGALVAGSPSGRTAQAQDLEPWRQALLAARAVAAAVHARIEVESEDAQLPWHPGRCARIVADGQTIGHAGELHPRVAAACELPPRTAAMELDLDRLIASADSVIAAPRVWTYPVVKEDVALIVDDAISAAKVADALRAGGGQLLESVRFFDEYRGSQIPQGRKSIAFALRFRASDRTLDDAEVADARHSAVAAAVEAFGAVLREA